MRIRMGNLKAQIDTIQPRLQVKLDQLLSTSSYILGPEVAQFEKDFASFTGASHVVACANGTDALELIIQGLDIPVNSSIVVPANSFVATAEAVINCGFRLKLVDVGEDFQIDISSLVEVLDDSVAAIVVVHLYGYPNRLQSIIEAIGSRKVHIIEDCAQAHGARLGSQHVGTAGVAGAFSFYPGKNLGAIGDAGAVTTNDAKLAERIRRISNHGRLQKFDHQTVGRNSRMDSIQAMVLSLKLEHLGGWNEIRRRNARIYYEILSDLPLTLPPRPSDDSVFHHFVIRTAAREELRDYLHSQGVESGVHYPEAISQMSPYLEFDSIETPIASSHSRMLLSLPVAEHITETEVEEVCELVAAFFRTRTRDYSLTQKGYR